MKAGAEQRAVPWAPSGEEAVLGTTDFVVREPASSGVAWPRGAGFSPAGLLSSRVLGAPGHTEDCPGRPPPGFFAIRCKSGLLCWGLEVLLL